MTVASSSRNSSTLSPRVARFFAWWGGELRALIPAFLKDDAHRSRAAVMVRFGEADVAVLSRSGRGWRKHGEVALDGSASAEAEKQAFQALIGEAARPGTPIVLGLPMAGRLRRIADFPASAETDLRRILENQMGRLTPYRAEQVYFDFRIVERNPATSRIQVELIAMPRDRVDTALSRLLSWGATAELLDIGAPDEPGVELLRLGGNETDRRRGRLLPWVAGTLAVANLALIGAVVGLPLMEKARMEKDLAIAVAELRQRANTVADLREKAEKLTAEAAFLGNRASNVPRAIVVLQELTRTLPDGTWLERASLEKGVVRIYGNSPQAAALIAITEKSALFHNVRFRAPVTQQGPRGTERFQISADLVKEDGG